MHTFCNNRKGGSDKQDDNHQIFKLIDEFWQEAAFFTFIQLVIAIGI